MINKYERARGEVNNVVAKLQMDLGVTTTELDGVLSSILSEIRNVEKLELLNEHNEAMREKIKENEELKKKLKEFEDSESGKRKCVTTT